jgi:hypothetical protein
VWTSTRQRKPARRDTKSLAFERIASRSAGVLAS